MSELIRAVAIPLDGVTLSMTVTRKAIKDYIKTQDDLRDIPDDVLYESAIQTLEKMSEHLMSDLALQIDVKAYEYHDSIEKERIQNMPKNDLPLLVGHEFESKENEELWEQRLKS